MKLEVEPANEPGKWTGIAILVVGILIGLLLPVLFESEAVQRSVEPRPDREAMQLESYLRRKSDAEREQAIASATNGLETLVIDFDESEAMKLQELREVSMNRGIIIQDEEDMIRGTVALGEASGKADLRIKGDWTDHIDTDKWSLRIKLKDTKLAGMSVFSIQHPKTRGMLWEWLALEAARREGLLAPRATFVNVVVNGNAMGVYYLEEHFSKELLESQGRREGPIVLWDEGSRWSSMLQAHVVAPKGVNLDVPANTNRIWGANAATTRAYGEKRLSSIESLSRSLYGGIEKMVKLQELIIAESESEENLTRMTAMRRIQGETIDGLLNTELLGRMHALISLFQIKHAVAWHNMRFYHDPLLDRLEPILFDCNAQQPSVRDVVMFRAVNEVSPFNQSDSYYNEVFESLGYFCEPDYLDRLLATVGEELALYEAALNEEFRLPTKYSVPAMFQRLRAEQAFLRTVIYPVDPINFRASYSFTERPDSQTVTGAIIVDAWATTRTPVVLEGFEFREGALIPARGVVDPGSEGLGVNRAGGLVLPNDGRLVQFRFPIEYRLANLKNVRQLVESLETPGEEKPVDLEVFAVFRPIAEEETTRELLNVRVEDPRWADEGGRPAAPTLAEALRTHAFLEYRAELNELWVRPGRWKVTGDLVVPSGFTLYAASAQLSFEEDAVFLTDSPLIFRDVALQPQKEFDRWRGVVVLQAGGRSTWDNVRVSATDSVARAGWTVTGGITFYRSPVMMTDCHIDGTLAEDGTNIFGSDFELRRTRFSNCVSDSFDGDFVSGSIVACTFEDGLADGVDVSGSNVLIEECQFLRMGDKGISAGENSTVRVIGGLCDDISLGIASKDSSRVEVEGMSIKNARNYALTAFIKKAEFGPSQLVATGVSIENSGRGHYLVQTGCTLAVDGVEIETTDLDVEQLYRDKVLGQ